MQWFWIYLCLYICMGNGAVGYAWEEAEREEGLTRGLGWVWGAGLVVSAHESVVVYLMGLEKSMIVHLIKIHDCVLLAGCRVWTVRRCSPASDFARARETLALGVFVGNRSERIVSDVCVSA